MRRWKSFCVWTLLSREWLWVDSNGTDGKPTFHRHANLSWFSKICNHFREIAAWSRKSLTLTLTFFFGKIDPLRANFQKIIPKGFTTSQNQSCVVYLTKNKTSARSPALASARIAPKICQGQLQTIYSEFPKFHPNPFTSSKVIAERMNIVETHHKVFPILGKASLSSN